MDRHDSMKDGGCDAEEELLPLPVVLEYVHKSQGPRILELTRFLRLPTRGEN